MRVKSCRKKSVFKVSVNSQIMNLPLPEEEIGKTKGSLHEVPQGIRGILVSESE